MQIRLNTETETLGDGGTDFPKIFALFIQALFSYNLSICCSLKRGGSHLGQCSSLQEEGDTNISLSTHYELGIPL